jgi:hypothetical protein
MERVTKRAARAVDVLLVCLQEAVVPEHEYGQHWTDWRPVAEGILLSTPQDRQGDAIGYAHELAEKQLMELAAKRVDETTWKLEVTRLYIAYVEPNFVKPCTTYLENFMKGLWDDDWSLSFDWTLADDEGNVAKALGMATWPRYQPYMLQNVMTNMGLNTEETISSAEAMLFIEQRISPHCKDNADRAVFLNWHADCTKRGVFDEAERQRLAQLGARPDAPIVL